MPAPLLLVGSESARLAETLASDGGPDVTSVDTVAEARAYLAGTAFDAVAVQAGLEGAEALGALAAGLGVPRGVLVFGDAADLAARLGAHLGRALAPATPLSPAAAPGPADVPSGIPDDVRAALDGLRDELARVAHDLANPLAVVVGNAQLGAELARVFGADEAIGQAFADIEDAGGALAARLGQLAALRARLDGFR